MNRRSFFCCGVTSAACFLAALTSVAGSARLPTSTLLVDVLSVDRKSFESGRYANGSSWEKTSFVAKAQIRKILHSDHGLKPGDIIRIDYDVLRPSRRAGTVLNQGANATVTVFGHGREFRLRQ
jgi:hypothetical protein